MRKYVMLFSVVLAVCLTGCQKDEVSGTELLKQGDYEGALEKFEQAIEDKHDQQEAYRGVGIAYWEMGDYKRARAAFTKALSYGAEETGTICNFIAVCDMELGYMESAGEWFAKGLEKEGNSDELTKEMEFNQIVVCEKLGDWEQAREKLTVYLNKHPDDQTAQKEAEFLETR